MVSINNYKLSINDISQLFWSMFLRRVQSSYLSTMLGQNCINFDLICYQLQVQNLQFCRFLIDASLDLEHILSNDIFCVEPQAQFGVLRFHLKRVWVLPSGGTRGLETEIAYWIIYRLVYRSEPHLGFQANKTKFLVLCFTLLSQKRLAYFYQSTIFTFKSPTAIQLIYKHFNHLLLLLQMKKLYFYF